ncbi:MAG: glutaredoxin 3 [Methylosarcina sp.]
MAEIVIYTTRMCPYCIMAKRLLDKKGVSYTEIDVESNPRLREELIRKSKRRTVPQIYIGDLHIGGFDELYALDRLKKLDPLLGINHQ